MFGEIDMKPNSSARAANAGEGDRRRIEAALTSALCSTVLSSSPTDVFQAMVITSDRLDVLSALTSQAAEHFGHHDLLISQVRVSPDSRSTSYLATGDFRARHPRTLTSESSLTTEGTSSD